jgi:hypothetical protein
MNDELDTLRSFRPEAAGPTDALTTEGRNALMTASDAERLPRPARRRRRLVRVGLVLAAALVVVGSVAAASGLIPDDVRQSLGLANDIDPVLAPNADAAVKRASAATSDGGTVELWTAPTNGGGTCAYLRHLDPSGAPADDRGVACEASLANGGMIGSATRSSGSDSGVSTTIIGSNLPGIRISYHLETGAGRPVTLYGKAPAGASEIAVTDADSTVATAAVTEGGWWLLVVPASTDVDSLEQLEARSGSGATVAATPIRSATPPQGPGTVVGGLELPPGNG